jgi:hypothetical protein
VVASRSLESPSGAVGAVGVPVKAGEASGATSVGSGTSWPLLISRPAPTPTGCGPPGPVPTRPSSMPLASVSAGCAEASSRSTATE